MNSKDIKNNIDEERSTVLKHLELANNIIGVMALSIYKFLLQLECWNKKLSRNKFRHCDFLTL